MLIHHSIEFFVG